MSQNYWMNRKHKFLPLSRKEVSNSKQTASLWKHFCLYVCFNKRFWTKIPQRITRRRKNHLPSHRTHITTNTATQKKERAKTQVSWKIAHQYLGFRRNTGFVYVSETRHCNWPLKKYVFKCLIISPIIFISVTSEFPAQTGQCKDTQINVAND